MFTFWLKRIHTQKIKLELVIRLLCLSIFYFSFPLHAKESISFLINPSSAIQQRAYFELVANFENQYPQIKVVLVTEKPDTFKQTIADFIKQGQAPADVMLVYAGQQLRLLHENNRIWSLDQLGLRETADSVFSRSTLEAVTAKEQRFAIPLSYYQWGIYYNRSLFERLQLQVPQNLAALLQIVKTLREQRITPFSFCPESPWSILAWLDYLNLRINGLGSHKTLLSGKTSFDEPSMQTVLNWWLTLVNAGAFDNKSRLNWQECWPYLYRELTAMTLMGNFALAKMPKEQHNKLGFFRFPQYQNNSLIFEDVPLDVVVLNKSNASELQQQAVKQFAAYLMEAETQSKFNLQVDKIAPNIKSEIGNGPFIQQGKALIDSSHGYLHYFDREAPGIFSSAVADILINSIKTPVDLQSLTKQLEAARQKSFAEALFNEEQ